LEQFLPPDFPNPNTTPPPAASCTALAAEAVQLGQKASNLKCGFNLSTDAASYQSYCTSTPASAVGGDISARRSAVEQCEACRAYAKAAVSAAVDNVRYECGFGGPRWDTSEGNHFGWCMGLRGPGGNIEIGGLASVPVPGSWEAARGQAAAEAGARAQQIAQCKATHVPRDCKSCHGGGSSQVSAVPLRTSPSALRATSRGGGAYTVKQTPDTTPPKGGSGVSKAMSPGLLEGGGGGFTPQGPAAQGTAVGGGTGSMAKPAGGGGGTVDYGGCPGCGRGGGTPIR
jgi:hypothetical protein